MAEFLRDRGLDDAKEAPLPWAWPIALIAFLLWVIYAAGKEADKPWQSPIVVIAAGFLIGVLIAFPTAWQQAKSFCDQVRSSSFTSQGFGSTPRDNSIDLSGVDIGEASRRCTAAGM